MSAPCLYGPEPPGEITMDLAGREPAGLVAAFGSSAWTALAASTSPGGSGAASHCQCQCVYRIWDSFGRRPEGPSRA